MQDATSAETFTSENGNSNKIANKTGTHIGNIPNEFQSACGNGGASNWAATFDKEDEKTADTSRPSGRKAAKSQREEEYIALENMNNETSIAQIIPLEAEHVEEKMQWRFIIGPLVRLTKNKKKRTSAFDWFLGTIYDWGVTKRQGLKRTNEQHKEMNTWIPKNNAILHRRYCGWLLFLFPESRLTSLVTSPRLWFSKVVPYVLHQVRFQWKCCAWYSVQASPFPELVAMVKADVFPEMLERSTKTGPR